MRHTPPPWKIGESMSGIVSINVGEDSSTSCVALALTDERVTNHNAAANARLIAAAPDLAVALRALLLAYTFDCGLTHDTAVTKAARLALAKALGGNDEQV